MRYEYGKVSNGDIFIQDREDWYIRDEAGKQYRSIHIPIDKIDEVIEQLVKAKEENKCQDGLNLTTK